MRQIEMLIQFISRMVFKKDSVKYEITNVVNPSPTDLLYAKLKALLRKSSICEAEDLLFLHYEASLEYMKLAVDFYQTLNGMRDDELEAHHFSREEIRQGLNDLMQRYGLGLPE